MSDWRPPSNYQPFAPPFPTSSFAPGAVTGRVRSTHRLGTAIVWLFAVNVTMLLTSIVNDLYARHVFEGSADGFRSAALDRLQTTDDVRVSLFTVSFCCAVAALVVLPIWSHRVVKNAQLRGVPDVSPGLAVGGWFIPFANCVVPFVELRRATRPFIGDTANITMWQVLGSIGFLLQRSTVSDVDAASAHEHFLDAVSSLIVRQAMAAVVLVIALMYAIRAITRIDQTVSVALP